MGNKTQEKYKRAKELIPGGVQLLSKSPEQFAPGQGPGYFAKAKGCEVWDLDGNHYYDMTTNGIGACMLGFADPDVSAAVIRRVENGSMCTLNPPEEVELAERLIGIHPWAEQARFARTGGECAAMAVRIARATTGRQMVAVCGYSGWHDWYLAANLGEDDSLCGHLLPGLKPAGVPKNLRNTTVTFHFNNREEFDQVMDQYGDQLACVIMEPVRNELPKDQFLQHVRDRIHRAGGLLIYDEITIGWRYTFGGSHLVLGVQPDLATYAKALGNGHPIAAVIGTKAAMEGANFSFISSTYWTESIGPAAALATLDKMEKTRAWEYVQDCGAKVAEYWKDLGEAHGLPVHVENEITSLAHFAFTEHPMELKTLYTVLMLKKGFLGNTAIYPTLAHTPEVLELYRKAVDEVFGEIADILKKGNLEEAIGGPVCVSGFKRLN